MSDYNVTPLNSEELDRQIVSLFGQAATHKGRYKRFATARPGIPRHVMEGMIDSIAPGAEPLTPDQGTTVHQALTHYFPDREKVGEYRYRLVEKNDTLKLIVHVRAATDLRQIVA